MHSIKYRMFEPRLSPRRTKTEVPGWGGQPDQRRDGSHEYGWHCLPFVEGAQYGVELFYPFDNELRVTRRDGRVVLDGDFGPAPDSADNWPPFRSFGDDYYTYQILIDFKVPDEMAVLTGPHPRFFTSPIDDVPVAVPALLRTSWWPMISFVVFKTPPEGRTHVFRPSEPFMQMLFVPAEPAFELVVMNEEEAAERELRDRRIYASRPTLAKETTWCSSTNTVFDGTYRHLAGAARAKAKGRGTPS